LLRLSTTAACALLITAVSCPVAIRAQEQDENDPVKAASLVREAVTARGGEAFLRIRTAESHGQYTPFDKGVSGNPMSFVDYVAYPNRERTEFGKGDSKYIQTNSEAANWLYDAAQKMIRDQKDDQIKQFQQSARYDLENLLRTAWHQSGVKLVYLGRREPWRNTFSEAVRIEFTDGGAATLHLDPRSKLPLSIEYKTVGEGGTADNEVRYHRWVDFGGINFPTMQDAYRNGKQSARVSFDTVSFNVNLPDKLFIKPSNIKEVK
jgi:hypothetical protein